MSYSIELERADFAIPVASQAPALAAVASLYAEDVGPEPATLEAVFAELAWPLARKGDRWVLVDGEYRNLRYQPHVLSRVAPWVVEGSYVTVRGEDRRRFSWYFSRGACFHEESPAIELGKVNVVVPVSELRGAIKRVRDKLAGLVAKLGDPVSVTALFAALDWKTGRDAEGSLVLGGKDAGARVTRADERVLRAIAPFVATGSFIEAATAAHSWRYVFEGGRCTRRYDV